jgi:DNA-binding response OmpR family regulator
MRRILVVDSEPQCREAYRSELESEGFLVEATADHAEALRLAKTWEPDLAVLDVRPGPESGLDLLRRLVEANESLRTILVSRYPGYRDDFSSWLADAFLVKNENDAAELRERVLEILAGAELAAS